MTTTMARRLTDAADVLRVAADRATPGPWRRAADVGDLGKDEPGNFVANWDGEYLHRVANAGDGDRAAVDAVYIALTNPKVGRALAALLRAAADAAPLDPDEPPRDPRDRTVVHRALAAADVLLAYAKDSEDGSSGVTR